MIRIPLKSITRERKAWYENKAREAQEELQTMEKRTPNDLWLDDIRSAKEDITLYWEKIDKDRENMASKGARNARKKPAAPRRPRAKPIEGPKPNAPPKKVVRKADENIPPPLIKKPEPKDPREAARQSRVDEMLARMKAKTPSAPPIANNDAGSDNDPLLKKLGASKGRAAKPGKVVVEKFSSDSDSDSDFEFTL